MTTNIKKMGLAILCIMLLTTSFSMVARDDLEQQPWGQRTPSSPNNAGGLRVTVAVPPVNPVVVQTPIPQPAVPEQVTLAITLTNIPADVYERDLLNAGYHPTLAYLLSLRQRIIIGVEQEQLLNQLTSAPYNATVVAQTAGATNTIVVTVSGNQFGAIQALPAVRAVARVDNQPDVSLTVTIEGDFTGRPERNPGYPVITIEPK